jgi:hypothetical protein
MHCFVRGRYNFSFQDVSDGNVNVERGVNNYVNGLIQTVRCRQLASYAKMMITLNTAPIKALIQNIQVYTVPGPAVTTATPTVPDIRATASAANTAVTLTEKVS